jgi:type I restriction enzyme S subunit
LQVKNDDFEKIEILVPPLETQKNIAAFLDERTKAIDELVAKKEKMIELLREKRQSLITHVVTKGLDPKAKMKPSGIDWLGNVPIDWKKLPLKFLFSYQSGGVWGDEARGDENDVICVRVADFDFTEFVAHSSEYTTRNIPEIKKELILDEDSILLEKSGGGDQQPVGRAVRYLGAENATCSNFIQKLQVDKKYNSEFIILLLSMLYFNGVTMKVIKKTTGIQNLDLGAFLRTDIFLPSKDEQTKMVEFINAKSLIMTEAIKMISHQIDQLKECRSSLIYSAVTGKIKI